MLLKMAQRRSNRKLSWENSLWKFDHSARDANGDPVRRREMMAKDSIVRAPEIYNPKAVLTKIREEEVDASGQDRHVESEDRKGAQVRDVEAALIEVIDTAGASSCGGWATAGTQSDPHWIMYTMDGVGCTHSTSGVRVSFFAGSVRKMNQSRHGVRNLATPTRRRPWPKTTRLSCCDSITFGRISIASLDAATCHGQIPLRSSSNSWSPRTSQEFAT